MASVGNWEGLTGPIPSVVERYYTKYYATDVKGRAGEDQTVLLHSNKIMVICLAPTHPLITSDVSIKGVEFQIGKLDRTDNTVSGRFKKGGQKLTPTSPVGIVHTVDDQKYILYSCVKGVLLEVNEQLMTNPQLLQTQAEGQGYIAIVQPNKPTDTPCASLLTQEEYTTLRKLK